MSPKSFSKCYNFCRHMGENWNVLRDKIKNIFHFLTFKLYKLTLALYFPIKFLYYHFLVFTSVLWVGLLTLGLITSHIWLLRLVFWTLRFSAILIIFNDIYLSDVCWASLYINVYVCACFILNIMLVMTLLYISWKSCAIELISVVGWFFKCC